MVSLINLLKHGLLGAGAPTLLIHLENRQRGAASNWRPKTIIQIFPYFKDILNYSLTSINEEKIKRLWKIYINV